MKISFFKAYKHNNKSNFIVTINLGIQLLQSSVKVVYLCICFWEIVLALLINYSGVHVGYDILITNASLK